MVELLQRNIGIIADGGSDYTIIQHIVESILSGNYSSPSELKFVELRRQSIRDYVDKYWRDSKTDPALPSQAAIKFRNNVSSVLVAAFDEFSNELESGTLTNNDILLLTSDAERCLSSETDYLEGYGFHLVTTLESAIAQFYRLKTSQGSSYKYLPLILPLIFFPSTEIFVAAAKSQMSQSKGKKPSELKMMLYGTDNLKQVSADDLKEKALDYIDEEGIQKIYQNIPESRLLIQTISTLNPIEL